MPSSTLGGISRDKTSPPLTPCLYLPPLNRFRETGRPGPEVGVGSPSFSQSTVGSWDY